MRDNFSQAVKRKLAERVAWRCSFPDCPLITIGPGHERSDSTVNLGEAAHIHAASNNGPRFNPHMTAKERKSIDNGIWLCKQHARLIDTDFIKYSADTIKQWKLISEENTYKALKNLSNTDITFPTTLVAIGSKLIFEGIWKGVKSNESELIFDVKGFVVGDIETLLGMSIGDMDETSNYVVIETQGDGRKLRQKVGWKLVDNCYEITLQIEAKTDRSNPDLLSDIDSGLTIENGDFKIVKGIECAKQIIENTLSMGFGELFYAPKLGSHFSDYYRKFKDNSYLLNRLLKLELTRLVFIPSCDVMQQKGEPPLSFVNRIISAEVLSTEIVGKYLSIRLNLEWGNGKLWEDELNIYIHDENYEKNETNILGDLEAFFASL
jgi:hypothetical protein